MWPAIKLGRLLVSYNEKSIVYGVSGDSLEIKVEKIFLIFFFLNVSYNI